jgi:hypothetical protein
LAESENASKRLARIKLLAGLLHSKSTDNTEGSRRLCRRIALELIELLKAEDAYQLSVSVPVPVLSTRRL